MPKLILQVFLVCGWVAQILEGSPMTDGVEIQENLQENQIAPQHITPEQLRSLQVIIIIIIINLINIIIVSIIIIIILIGIRVIHAKISHPGCRNLWLVIIVPYVNKKESSKCDKSAHML